MFPFRSTWTSCGLSLLLLSLSTIITAAAASDGSMSVAEAHAAFPECARPCLDSSIAQSTCIPTDFTCLCNDRVLTDTASSCIRSSCTVKETLVSRNISSHVCGLPVEADDSLIPIYSVFIAFAVVAVVLRLVARVVTQAHFWWDDLANLLSFIGAAIFTGFNIKAIELGQGKDMWFVPFDDVTAVVRMFFADMLLYAVSRFFFRASIILFYIRIFSPTPDNKAKKFGRLLTGTMIFNFVFNFTFIMAIIFLCRPLPYLWTQWEGLHEGHCGDYNTLAWVAAATGIAFDLWMLALPLSQLMTLNLPWRRKLMGGLMFFFGIGVMLVSLIRLKTINEFTQTVNPTKDIVQVCLWSGIELDVGVICPCLPSIRLLLRRMLPAKVVSMGSSARRELESLSNRPPTTVGGGRKGMGVIFCDGMAGEGHVGSRKGSSDWEGCEVSVTGLVEGGDLAGGGVGERRESGVWPGPGGRGRESVLDSGLREI